jgi:predicted transcriptional regulator
MNTIMLSIHPEFARLIMTGEKRFEFRTRVAKLAINRIVLYATVPECRIVGEVSVEGVLCSTPESLWQRTSGSAGITQTGFFNYFRDRETAYAYSLHSPLKYAEPKELSDFGITSPPQSFIYIDAP